MSNALTGGEWRPDRRGILRWHQIVEAVEESPVAPDVACPTCGAKTYQGCKSRNGASVGDHVARKGRPTCPCGAPRVGRRHYCDPCQAEARRESFRLYRARRRGSDQVAA